MLSEVISPSFFQFLFAVTCALGSTLIAYAIDAFTSLSLVTSLVTLAKARFE